MYGDPDHLDALAGRLRTHAADVRQVAWDHLTAASNAHWVSDSAQVYRDEVYNDRVQANATADDLEATADALVAHAQVVRERIAQLAALAAAAAQAAEDGVEFVVDTATDVGRTAAELVESGASAVVDGVQFLFGNR